MSFSPNGASFIGNGLPPGYAQEYPNYTAFCNYVDTQFGGSTQWNWQLFDTLYRTSWVAEKCVTVLADDMFDQTREFIHDDPEVVEIRKAYEEENNINGSFREWAITGNLYGGSAIIPIIEGQFNDEMFQKPFDIESVKLDSLKGLQVLSKFDFQPFQGINRDIFLNPQVFGDFTFYKIIRIQTMQSIPSDSITNEPVSSLNLPTIHVTRMIKYFGKELMYYQKFFSGGWGDSILTPIITKIGAIEESFHLMFLYLDLFNIDEVKIPNLSAIVNSNGGANLFRTYTAFRDKMRKSKLRFMDKNDEMNRNQLDSIQNIVPAFQSMVQFAVAATGIPLTRIMGISASNFNSTGDNELTQYYDLINQKRARVAPQIRQVDEIIERSLFGKKMGIRYRWPSKREIPEKEKEEIQNLKAQTFQIYMQNKVMTPQVVGQNISREYEGMDEAYIDSLEEEFLDYSEMDEDNYGPENSELSGNPPEDPDSPEKDDSFEATSKRKSEEPKADKSNADKPNEFKESKDKESKDKESKDKDSEIPRANKKD